MAKWIQGAVKHKGRIKAALGVPAGESIPASKKGKLHKLAQKSGGLGAAARLAERFVGGEFKHK